MRDNPTLTLATYTDIAGFIPGLLCFIVDAILLSPESRKESSVHRASRRFDILAHFRFAPWLHFSRSAKASRELLIMAPMERTAPPLAISSAHRGQFAPTCVPWSKHSRIKAVSMD
jgi:hypothetical protein